MIDQTARKARPVLDVASRPILPRHVKLRFDKARDRWVILAPERVLVPDDISVEVLQLCDGQNSVADIVAILAAKYCLRLDMLKKRDQTTASQIVDRYFESIGWKPFRAARPVGQDHCSPPLWRVNPPRCGRCFENRWIGTAG